MLKNDKSLIDCHECGTALVSTIDQELPIYFDDVLLLGCRNCFPEGYQQYRFVDNSLKMVAKVYGIKLIKRKKYNANHVEAEGRNNE